MIVAGRSKDSVASLKARLFEFLKIKDMNTINQIDKMHYRLKNNKVRITEKIILKGFYTTSCIIASK